MSICPLHIANLLNWNKTDLNFKQSLLKIHCHFTVCCKKSVSQSKLISMYLRYVLSKFTFSIFPKPTFNKHKNLLVKLNFIKL